MHILGFGKCQKRCDECIRWCIHYIIILIIIIKFYSKKSQLIEVKLSDQKSLKRIDYFTLLARENFPGNYKITGNNYHLFCSDQQEFEKLDNLINEKKYQFELASAIFDEMIKRGSHCLDNLENDIYKENLTYLELSNKINQKIKVNFSEVKDGNILFYLYRHNILEYNQDESGKEELDRIYLVSQIKFMCKGCKNSYRKKINILIN